MGLENRMSDWLRSASMVRSGRRKRAKKRSRLTLELELLEDRVVLSSLSLSTTPGGTVILGSGVNLTDSATLSGGSSPTGSITFTLTAPGGSTVDTERVTVSGDGTYNTPNGFLPTTAGTYEWAASYSGDLSNNSVASVAAETVSPASPSLVTTPSPSTATLGTAVSDGGKLLGNALSFAAGGNTGTTPIALLATEDGNNNVADVERTLAAYGGFSLTSIEVEDSTPTLATLENYKAVLVWSDFGFNNPTQLGNVLASYVNAGGGDVIAWSADSTFSSSIAPTGTWVSGGYSPYVYGYTYSPANATIGKGDLPSSPVMKGVTNFDIGPGFGEGGFAAEVSLAPGATDIADLTSGYSLAAEMTGFPRL
jgi:hypothetical protein